MAIGLIPAAAGAALSLLGGGQVEKQEQLNRVQEESTKRLAEFQQGLALDMWDKTGVKGQVKAMKEAGMNPAAMYGGSGAGGQLGAGLALPAGGQAATDVAKQQGAVQTGLAIANLDLMKAQTNKTNAEADQIAGADTELKNAQAGAVNAEAAFKTVLTKIQNDSLKDQLRAIKLEADKLFGEASSANTHANIMQGTQELQMNKIENEALSSAIQLTSQKLGNELTKARVQEIAANIQQKWKDLNIQQDKTGYEHQDRVRAIEEYTSTTLKAAGIAAAGQVVGDIVKIATRQLPNNVTETMTKQTDKFGRTTGGTHTRTTQSRQ